MNELGQQFLNDLSHTTWLEYIAVIAGIASVWYSKKENILVYPVGLINTIIYIFLSVRGHLYGEASVNFYYTVVSLYGWIIWARRDGHSHEHLLQISFSDKKEWTFQLLFFATFYAVLYFVLSYLKKEFSPGAIPWADAFASAGTTKEATDAFWLGTAQSGMSGIMLARALGLEGKPVTRVENYCATGSEALRQAAYAVASGAYDSAMAIGVEKVKDSGYQGLNAFPIPTDGTNRTLTAAAMFSMVAPAYAAKYGVDRDELKRVLARIASKNHANGARNPRAQFRREMSVDQICAMPAVAGDLSVFDCAGVADGAAAAPTARSRNTRWCSYV